MLKIDAEVDHVTLTLVGVAVTCGLIRVNTHSRINVEVQSYTLLL